MRHADVGMCAIARRLRAACDGRHIDRFEQTNGPKSGVARRTECPPGHSEIGRLTKRGRRCVAVYWQVAAAVGFVSQYTRVPKLSGPWRAIAAFTFSLFAEISVVE